MTQTTAPAPITEAGATEVLAAMIDDFVARTPLSAAHWQEALRCIPSGVTKPEHFFAPHPIYLDHCDGARLVDLDGNTYVDLTYVGTSLPLGHNNAAIRHAIAEQLQHGTGYPKASTHPTRLAQVICDRLPSVDQVLFTDSGSKAVYFALRLARAFTGREKVGKFVGAFHGTHDSMWFGLGQVFNSEEPLGTHEVKPGVLHTAADDVVLLPFDDIDECARIIEAHASELGSVIVEPVLGDGYLPPSPTFLADLEKVCNAHGILVVFDEMITLSLGRGGAQGHFGVTPDLTTMGKPLGAGMPIAAVGGRADVMALASCLDGAPVVGGLSSTFAGHPLAAAAGLAQMEQLTDDAYARLWQLGERCREGINALGAELGVPLQATGIAHFLQVHWNEQPVRGFEDHNACDRDLLTQLDTYVFLRGYAVLRNHRIALSLSLTDADVDDFLACLEDGVRLLAGVR